MLKFSEDHEWTNLDADICAVGISPHAVEQLGDIVFVELPDIGLAVNKGDGCLLYTSPSPRDGLLSRMPSSA